tara:strand:- start:530 stop:1156 length:627 start_codon:yes stop_codon:yes gene_type:complete
MKTLFFTLFLSLPLFATENATIVKVFDGSVATCKSAQDVQRTQLGVYRAKVVSSVVTKTKVNFVLQLDMLKCKRSFTGYAFVLQNPFTDFSFIGRDGSLTNASVKELNLKGYVDGQYKLIVDERLRKLSSQLVRFSVNLADLVGSSPADQLSVGESRILALDIWMTKKMRMTNVANRFDDISTVNYGAYRIRVKAKGTATEPQIIVMD